MRNRKEKKRSKQMKQVLKSVWCCCVCLLRFSRRLYTKAWIWSGGRIVYRHLCRANTWRQGVWCGSERGGRAEQEGQRVQESKALNSRTRDGDVTSFLVLTLLLLYCLKGPHTYVAAMIPPSILSLGAL